MKRQKDWSVTEFSYNTIIVGTGAAGMNCAKKIFEYLKGQGVEKPAETVALVTAGKGLGASRMSGSDKQTYYKLGTSPDTPDSARHFAKSLTSGGCCHEDLALAEAIGSLRGFYNLVEAGVPFPHDEFGSYIGYKTDHDPYERATSAGPRTSRIMSQCLEKIVDRYTIRIFDAMEAAELLLEDRNGEPAITGIAAIDKQALSHGKKQLAVFYCNYLVLAAGGPGSLYKTTVYPPGQTGMHGLAFKAGLEAENITESQFGLASTKFRWNVSGTYMQVIPRIYSTNSEGGAAKDFLSDYFPSMRGMASAIFLKGYQWPFDARRVSNHQSSLIDLLVDNETRQGRRVFMDFLQNPRSGHGTEPFTLENLEDEAREYLVSAGATQQLPIERLSHMNPQALEIYREHGIDLRQEPLEIAVCAQHNNGGFAVDKWWRSNIGNTFIIGEMAGTHGVIRPGGSALNAGQVGAERAAQYIAHLSRINGVRSSKAPSAAINSQLAQLIDTLRTFEENTTGLDPEEVLSDTRQRMTDSAAHIRHLSTVKKALDEACVVHRSLQLRGFRPATNTPKDLVRAVQAGHVLLASIAYLQAIVDLLESGGGSRGSYLVLSQDGLEVQPGLKHSKNTSLKYKKETIDHRKKIQRIRCVDPVQGIFSSELRPVRKLDRTVKPFETAWKEYREKRIYEKPDH